jgi:AraC family transcriptional regulator of arabinose operon
LIMKYFHDIQFISAGELPCCSLRLDRVIEDHYSLEFVAGGEMVFAMDGRPPRTLYAPCLHWHAPGHSYRYGPAEGRQGWHHIFFTFRGPRAKRVIETGVTNLSANGFLFVHSRQRVLRIFREIVAQVSSRWPGYVPKACVGVEELLTLLEAEKRMGGLVLDSRERIQALLESMSRRPEQNITAATAAEEACLSTSHFRKLFRTYTGKPFHHYLLETRMYYAARQFSDPHTSIKELARQLGYAELSDFSRAFRRILGTSPRQYRKSLPLTFPAK